jgi:hypothetical protein
MTASDNRTALTDEVARFQAEIQRLALAAVRAIIEQELDERLTKREPARQRRRKPEHSPKRKAAQRPEPQLELRFVQEPGRQLELPLARQAEPERSRHAEAEHSAEIRSERQRAGASDPSGTPEVSAAVPVPHERPSAPPASGRKRGTWTRESIVSELATWMLSGTTIDAAFMTRHGPPGLVSAIRRVFGRFEAAMNVAALHVSKLYPDGPPSRGAGLDRK